MKVKVNSIKRNVNKSGGNSLLRTNFAGIHYLGSIYEDEFTEPVETDTEAYAEDSVLTESYLSPLFH